MKEEQNVLKEDELEQVTGGYCLKPGGTVFIFGNEAPAQVAGVRRVDSEMVQVPRERENPKKE